MIHPKYGHHLWQFLAAQMEKDPDKENSLLPAQLSFLFAVQIATPVTAAASL